MNRGDRLVFSNGILILSVLAGLLIYIFDAELNKLIQLYLVGVFISFTLSQTGMVMHWRKVREPGWRRSSIINGVGATMTAIVLVVVVATKFLEGAWIVITAIPILMYMMYSIHTHYTEVGRSSPIPTRLPKDKRAGHQNVVILVHKVDAATARAVGYVRSIRPATMRAVALDGSVRAAWQRLAPEIPLDIVGTTQGDAPRPGQGLPEGAAATICPRTTSSRSSSRRSSAAGAPGRSSGAPGCTGSRRRS